MANNLHLVKMVIKNCQCTIYAYFSKEEKIEHMIECKEKKY